MALLGIGELRQALTLVNVSVFVARKRQGGGVLKQQKRRQNPPDLEA